MEILVCIKRVPDTAENEIEMDSTGTDIKRGDLVYSVNEWDNYAVEEALRIREKHCGSVTVATVDTEAGDEVLRRELGMGADKAVHIMDQAFVGLDGRGVAKVLKAEVEKGNYDLVLTGVQAEDGAAQVSGLLAAMLDWPYASIVNGLEVLEGKRIKVGREVAGGNQEIYEMNLPCVISIQTGINEPRYVGLRGVRKAATIDIPIHRAGDLGITTEDIRLKVKRRDYFIPDAGQGAEILQGSSQDILDQLIDRLKAKGGIR